MTGWTRKSGDARPAGHPYTDDARGPRLQKVLREAGVGSRRACEALIESGEVTVNGTVVRDLPAWGDPVRDRIQIGRRRIRPPQAHVYVLLFKPRGVVCTNDRTEQRRRAIDLVQHPSGARLHPVGRLDIESSGLLLLTNDGDLANRVTHPRYGVHKVYELTVAGVLDEAAVRRLEAGIFLTDRRRRRGRKTTRSRLTLLRSGRDRTRLLLTLAEGRNRQIRRMMLRVGHKVRKLRRVQLGPLELKGLRVGQWRDLTPPEVERLRRAGAKRQRRGGVRGERGPRR